METFESLFPGKMLPFAVEESREMMEPFQDQQFAPQTRQGKMAGPVFTQR
jgi:hypothetical protein